MEDISPEEKVRSMTFVYLPLIVIPAVAAIACVCLFTIGSIVPESPHMTGIYWIVAYVAVPAGLAAGLFSFRQTMSQINRDESTVGNTLTSFQSSFLKRCVCFELPAWLGVVFYYRTGELSFLSLTAAALAASLIIEATVRSRILKVLRK